MIGSLSSLFMKKKVDSFGHTRHRLLLLVFVQPLADRGLIDPCLPHHTTPNITSAFILEAVCLTDDDDEIVSHPLGTLPSS